MPDDRASGPANASKAVPMFTVASAVIIAAGLFWGRDILAPFLVAALLVVLTYPARRVVELRGGPSWLGTAVILACSYAILIAMAALLYLAAVQFADLVPQFAEELDDASEWLAHVLASAGVPPPAASSASGWLSAAPTLDAAIAIVERLAGAVTAFGFVLGYVFFLAADSRYVGIISRRFVDSKGPRIASLARLASGIRRYFAINSVFGAIVAVLDVVLLLVAHVPGAVIWGVLAFVTNFIPNIGFVLALVPVLGIALLSGGWPVALLVLVGYVVINVVVQTLIQPRFAGKAVQLVPTLAFASVVAWSFLLGPVGALLAVPLTLTSRTLVLEGGGGSMWLRWLTGDRTTEET